MTAAHDELSRRLEEAALLAENDPRRQEIVAALDASVPAEREQWCAILAENEKLRWRLRAVELPTGLMERLRNIRETARPAKRRRILPMVASAAATLAVAVSLWWVTSGWLAARLSDRAVHELAVLAALDHAARPTLSVRSDELEALSTGLHDAPFALKIVAPEPGAALVGGRVCTFDDRPILYTCWRHGDEDIAVYQVRRREFRLVANLPPSEVETPERGSPVSRCRVRVWTDADYAYVIVHDQRRPGG